MEEDSQKRDLSPQLLHLIPNRDWMVGDAGGGGGKGSSNNYGAEEEKKLELKLGPPGVEEESSDSKENKILKQQRSSSVLFLGYFPKPSSLSSGAKRGFFDTVEPKSEGYHDQQQKQQQLQGRAGLGKELSLGTATSGKASEKLGCEAERKKGCCPPPAAHAAGATNNSSPQARITTGPAVGWPPVGIFRRNLASSSSKQSLELRNVETDSKAEVSCKKGQLVKINMDGIPIGRKINLAAYDNYEKLSLAVKELFLVFLEAQKDVADSENGGDEKIFSRLLDGTGEYTLVYEDNEGDKVLVGDVPWNDFVSTAKRLRVLKSSDLSSGLSGAVSRRTANS